MSDPQFQAHPPVGSRLHALLLVITALAGAWLTLAAAILERFSATMPGGSP